MRDGKIGTEQACCCCCVKLIAYDYVVGLSPEDWECCWKPMFEEYVARLAAAGWTATIVESEGLDPNGDPVINVSFNIDSCCALDCEHFYGNLADFSNQPEGVWVDLSVGGTFFPQAGGIFFGGFAISGCCQNLNLTPAYINGEGIANGAPSGGHWIPACNPLP
jgi:hypothetical protein